MEELDLGSLASVRRFAARFNGQNRSLHLLVCNAGVMAPHRRLETPDGLEQQFQVAEHAQACLQACTAVHCCASLWVACQYWVAYQYFMLHACAQDQAPQQSK